MKASHPVSSNRLFLLIKVVRKMQNKDFEIKDLIKDKYVHMLWKDECGDDFLLLKWGEIYRYSKKSLALYIFSKRVCGRMQKKGLIFDVQELDEQFDLCFANVENLAKLLAFGAYSRRIPKNSKKLKLLEDKLTHKIFLARSKKEKTNILIR